MPQHVVTVTEVLDLHVALDIQYLETGIYLNTYVPTFKTPNRGILCRGRRHSLGAVRHGRCREQAGADPSARYGNGGFTKSDRRVSCYYFYLWDIDFGPAFIKVRAYFPYPVGFQKSA